MTELKIGFDGDVMVVNGVKLLKQSKTNNCGQTAVMMFTGRPLNEVNKAFGCSGKSNSANTAMALVALGCVVDSEWKTDGSIPTDGFIRIGFLKKSGGHYSTTGKVKNLGHLLMIKNGVIYDPIGRFYTLEQFKARVGIRVTHSLAALAP